MIIREYHQENFHAGPKLLEAKICEKYWITNECVTCAIHKCKTNVLANRQFAAGTCE